MSYGNLSELKKSINLLIIEKDIEMQYIYKQFFNVIASHINFTIVSEIGKMEDIINSTYDNSNNGDGNKFNRGFNKNNNDNKEYTFSSQKLVFDVIIVDISAATAGSGNLEIENAKRILEKNAKQRIIFTTTLDLYTIKEKMNNSGEDELMSLITILQKPFSLFDLLSLLVSSEKCRFDKVKLTDHVLALYTTTNEEISDAVGFIKRGFENNELNLLLIRKDMSIENTIVLLKSNGLFNINTLLKSKSLIILQNEQWYIPDDKVDKYRIINQWNDLVDKSVQDGKKGLRAFCMMNCFFENSFSKEVVDYEITLPSQFQIPFVPICAYRQSDLDDLPPREKEKLIGCHNHVIMV